MKIQTVIYRTFQETVSIDNDWSSTRYMERLENMMISVKGFNAAVIERLNMHGVIFFRDQREAHRLYL